MLVKMHNYNEILGDFTHSLDYDAVTYASADTTDKRILLPYRMDYEMLRDTLSVTAVVGGRLIPGCYEGIKGVPPCQQFETLKCFDEIVADVEFFLSVNIQRRRQDITLYMKITPTKGKPRMYHVSCRADGDEIREIVKRYLEAGNKTPHTWRDYVEAMSAVAVA